MGNYKITKGFDIKVLGDPEPIIEDLGGQTRFAVYPGEFEGIKPRLEVKVGDQVKRGQVLFFNKRMDKTLFRSPCAGVIKDIKLGARRFPIEISIEADAQGESETFQSYTTEEILNLDRNTLCEHLLHAGVWPFIKATPF